MRYLQGMLQLTLAAIIAVSAAAAHYSDFYVIPVAGHLPGAFDTFFRSDVAIQNISEAPITVEMAFIESGTGITNNVFPLGDPVTIGARGSALLVDLLEGYRGMDSAIGAILIGADQPFAVVSRAYTTGDEHGGTYGQTVPAVRDFIDNLEGTTNQATATAYIPGARSDAAFRTNIGIVGGANGMDGSPLTVEVQLLDQSGSSLGITQVQLAPGNLNHTQFSTAAITGETFTVGGVQMRVTSGNGVAIPYISVVDNITGDAKFVLGTFPPNQMSAKAAQKSLFRQIFERAVHNR